MLTQDFVKKVLDYDPETGVFTRTVCINYPELVGKPSGSISPVGYLTISLKSKAWYAHRLAFLYMTGSIPEYVDHINGIRTDNRWCNLRAATRSQNQANTKRQINNKSGVKGVYWCRRKNKWTGRFKHKGKNYSAGNFYDLISAELALRDLRGRVLGEFANHG